MQNILLKVNLYNELDCKYQVLFLIIYSYNSEIYLKKCNIL